MPTSKKTKTKKKSSRVSDTRQTVRISKRDVQGLPVRVYAKAIHRAKGLLARRPHRSFRRTYRRDYTRSLRIPGYWAFTGSVLRMLMQHKKLFLGLTVLYGVLTVALVGLASQDIYTELGDVLRDTSDEIMAGNLNELGKAGLLLTSVVTGTLNSTPTDLQRMYAVILTLLIWLTTVWLLRALLAGRRPRLRDGLYNASAPFLSTFLVSLVLVVQLLPVALVAIGFGAATSSGLLAGGIEAMVFWTAASLLAALSLYWMSSTLIALVVVTLPGMYPMQAIKTAGDLVIGRRVRILLRIIWLLFTIAMLWIVVMIPIILLDAWIKGIWPSIQWVPVIPVLLLIMGSISVVWSSGYMYLLYRKVVDDDAAPA